MNVLGNISGILSQVFGKISAPIAFLALALFILFLGWLLARGIQILVSLIFRTIQLDATSQRVGFTQILLKGDIKRSPADLLGDLFYWIVLLITFLTVAGISGLVAPTAWVDGVIQLLIQIFNAVLILGLAIYLAAFVAGVVYLIASNAGISYAKPLAKFAQYAVIITAIIVSLGIIGIKAEWITSSINVVIGGIALAFAIAFGLGCKDIAGDFITNLFRQK